MVPLLGGPHAADGGVTDGAMASKVCHLAVHCRQWTPLGVAVFSMPNGLHLDSVFLHSEDKTNEFGLVKEAVPGVAALYGCFPLSDLSRSEDKSDKGVLSAPNLSDRICLSIILTGSSAPSAIITRFIGRKRYVCQFFQREGA